MLQGVNVNLQPERYVVHWASDIIYVSLHSHHPNQLTTEVQPFPEKEDLKFYCRVMLQKYQLLLPEKEKRANF